jgi:aryl-alcohol dehydrogenase-like predicted oxidoreductase
VIQRSLGPRSVSAVGLCGMPMSIEGRPDAELAWEIALAPVVIPIPGASRPTSIQDSAKAAELELTTAEIAALTAAV